MRLAPTSLRSALLLYECAYLALVAVGGTLGGLWAYHWQQSSREAVRINSVLQTAGQIRGDTYRQLQEVTRARLTEDPSGLDEFVRAAERTSGNFESLHRTALENEQGAVEYLRQTYDVVREDMDKVYSNPYMASEAARMKLLDPAYEPWLLADFESALRVLSEILAVRQSELQASLDRWNRLAPLLMLVPLALALVMLLVSRYRLRLGFVAPMAELVEGAHALQAGNLGHRIQPHGVAELRGLARSFNRMAGELASSRDRLVEQQRQAALGALVPVVAHNIRNPLASIRAAAQLVDVRSDAGELAETRDGIIETVDRLERWTGSLLTYLHPLSPHRTSSILPEVVDGALSPLRSKLEEKKLKLYIDVREVRESGSASDGSVRPGVESPLLPGRAAEPETLICELDANLIEQALHGLLHNAVDASPRNGELRIDFVAAESHVQLSIQDQGPGIPFVPAPDDLTPLRSSKRFGTGLGIPFAFKVIKAHGGEISLRNLEEGGTRALVVLPRWVSSVSAPSDSTEIDEPHAAPAAAQTGSGSVRTGEPA